MGIVLCLVQLCGFLGLLFTCCAEEGESSDDGSNESSTWPLHWEDYYYWNPDGTVIKGLFPNVFNLASSATITVNATCGETGPEVYCKLVEHVSIREPQCGVCDASGSSPDKHHPITQAIDGTNRWWQSPTLQNGKQYEWVTLTLDLGQVYQVAYVIVKAAISPRPGNWILERSLDGVIYKPWQYYAISDTECWEVYGLRPTVGKPHYRSDEEVICTSYYSKLNPLENGEIHTSLVNGRPGTDGPSDKLRDFTKARYIRLRLQKIRTLNADLMMMQTDDPEKIDKSVTRRYFYSIKDISVGGQCVCFGHAKECPTETKTGKQHCKCEHNTCGESCDHCCPLYNQKPWRAGTNSDGAVCEKCQCFGHSDECHYDQNIADKKASLNAEGVYEGGGVCKNCKHHTSGINCEQCADGYYRPLGISKDHPKSCHKCQCKGPGMTGNCVKDDSHIPEGLNPGDCLCKAGFSGQSCNQCANGYRNYPLCEPCPCHSAGTVGGTTCEGECVCKLNVQGSRCDHCKHGYYNLEATNPDGCSQCFCFGLTDECLEGDWGIEIIQKMEDWRVTDINGSYIATPTAENGNLVIANDDMAGLRHYYWLAPPKYLGKKLYSYGADLKFGVSYVVARGDTSGTYTEEADLILEGNNVRLGHNWGVRPEEDTVIIKMPLREQGWFQMTNYGGRITPVSRETFTYLLNNLTRILIRAKFHTDQIEGALLNVGMETASKESGSLKRLKSVEKCICPPGYTGLSCELCSMGYRRVNTTLPNGICERCDCFNHAESCDPVTGRCQNCLHNTFGLKCDQCLSGYYGNARIGTPDDCKKCACPLELEENNFSPTCSAVTTAAGENDYICNSCPQGFEGDKCERCSEGYFGNPKVPGGYCQPCDCSGNVDTSTSGWCDKLTGQCLKCLHNTGGWNCGECLDGHYGSAEKRTCQPCDCSLHGSLSTQCDRATGQCLCKPNYVGRTCERCDEGYGNAEAGCLPCWCNRIGARSETCDPITGRCHCKSGVFGTRCESCLEGYYGFSDDGCKPCSCSSIGSLSPQCDEVNGQCACKPHVTGRACDRCEGGFWNLNSGQGCEECKCALPGSVSPVCDENTGQCNCRPGVGGRYCDQCLPGYFGFTPRGCRKCDPCDAPGHICDPTNGRCVCPPYTTGNRCQYCTPNAWGYDSVIGCKPCNCSAQGSPGQTCEPVTGACVCLEGFSGRHCDHCLIGHYNFPNCLRCDCNPLGTDLSHCQTEVACQCDDRGQCPCKVNVLGRSCDNCKEGAFGMSKDNLKGCHECFCFGRTSKCTQANMGWSAITVPSRDVTMEIGVSEIPSLLGFLLIPGQSGSARLEIPYVLDKPVYWNMASAFLGDRVLSYNGKLYFRVESRSGSQFPSTLLHRYPLVVLQGNSRLVLAHSPPSSYSGGHYFVKLHEDEWTFLDNPQIPVTRADIMVLLQNLQMILIRATDGADVKYARLDDVSLEEASQDYHGASTADGIEMCRCPRQYIGASCQDPAPGYYRRRKPDYLDSKDVLDLVGWAEPCACNNHSRNCDKETGVCMNCTGNTMGPHCNLCIKGYYGDPARGPCRPCACPLPANSFSDTCHPDGLDYVCIDCQLGYSGRHCERCAEGYYGNPSIVGGSCKPCECNPYGSQSRHCDSITGQCVCKHEIGGRDCTVCRHGFILTEHGCKSCDDECTGTLLTEVYQFKFKVESINLTDIPILPWNYLYTIDNTTSALQVPVSEYERKVDLGKQLVNNFTFYFDLEAKADLLYVKARDSVNKAPLVVADTLETVHEAEVLLADLDKIHTFLRELVDQLRRHGLDPIKFPGLSADRLLAEAEKILREIKLRDFTYNKEEADRELRKARNLLERVKKLTLDSHHLDELADRLDHLGQLLSDTMRRIDEDVQKPLEKTWSTIRTGRLRLSEVERTAEDIQGLADDANKTVHEASELLDKARDAVIDAVVKFEFLPRLLKDLENSTNELEELRSMLTRLNPLYKEKYVLPAVQHADDLERQAKGLAGLFNATREVSEFPLQAAGAYQEIVDALAAAEEAAKRADAAADIAYNKAYPDSDDALTKQAKKAKEISLRLLAEARQLRDIEVPELAEILDGRKRGLDKVAENIAQGQRNMDIINRELDALPKGIDNTLHDIDEKQQEALDKANKANKLVDIIQGHIDRELIPRLEATKAGSVAGLENLTKTIEKARSDIRDSTKTADTAQSSSHRVRQKHNQMQLNLKELKDKVLLARQKATSIRVAVSEDKSGQCVRSYKPTVEPTTTNNIILNYAIKSNHRDSLLLFLASSNNSKDFMAIEMVNRKIRFLWNVGGGTQVIEHTATIETNNEQLLKNEQWFKIEVNRIGNVATLSVKRTPDGQKNDPFEVSGAAPAGYSKMDLDSNSYFYIGGLPLGYQVPSELKTRSFAGCLYEVILDERHVGLWNFLTNKGCDGCKEGATEEADFSSYQFKGKGYAILPQIRHYIKSEITFSLSFKTFSEDALLFLSANPSNGDFISLELKNGHVVYQFSLGGRSKLTLQTRRKYNTGVWIRVDAGREGFEGQLEVESESLSDNAPRGGSTALDLKKSNLYFGGVPPNFTTTRWPLVIFTKFVGCMKDLQVDATPLHLFKSDHYDIEPGCKEKGLKAATFKGAGYLEFKGQALPSDASFGFSLLTHQPEALLLLSTFDGIRHASDENKAHFYSVSLVDGKAEARFSGGSGEINIYSDQKINDGSFHTIAVLKKNRKMFLTIDDRQDEGIRLTKATKDIEAPSHGGLYFGGAKGSIAVETMAASTQPLIGVIKDVVFNNKLLLFNEPVDFKSVDIGLINKMIGSPEDFEQTELAHPGESCAETPNYSFERHSVSFGDSSQSYIEKAIGKKDLDKDFNISIEFRTYHSDGLLIMVRNARKRNNHLVIMLRDGMIIVDLKVKKHQKKVVSQHGLNNGHWHKLRVIKSGHSLVLSVDDSKHLAKTVVKQKLALKGPVYIGGMPKALKNIETASSFTGCIKNLYINDKYQDIHAGNTNIKNCFSAIESGAFFGGSGYATYDKHFKLQQPLKISLHFKTTQLTGILLHLGNSIENPIFSLQLDDGQVVASFDTSSEVLPVTISRQLSSKYDVCDNSWHNISIVVSHGTARLTVDRGKYIETKIEKLDSSEKSAPLLIGGFPGEKYGQDNFFGCVRYIAFNEKPVDWKILPTLHKVSPFACPL